MQVGLEEAVVLLTASLILTEALLANYAKIPFTSGYGGLRYNIGVSLAIGVAAFFLFSPGLAGVEGWAMASLGVVPMVALIGSLVAGWAGVRRYATERPGAEAELVFMDDVEPFVPSMDLR